jgi:hypothetical protein
MPEPVITQKPAELLDDRRMIVRKRVPQMARL